MFYPLTYRYFDCVVYIDERTCALVVIGLCHTANVDASLQADLIRARTFFVLISAHPLTHD